jgi:two-component system, NtrC family, sensor kinase
MPEAVLVVDDSLTVRMDLAEALEEAGFRALPCASLAEARTLLAREAPALVILDMILPDGDGVELLQEIRATAPTETRVLILSGEAEVKDRIRGLQTGADDYVGKPYDTTYVVARARQLLRAGGIASANRATVLVIDDSTTFRQELRRALEEAGYAVLAASSGEEGLRIAARSRPCALLVDGVSPGIDGTSVIRKIRLDSALRGTPCILLTGSEGPSTELRALDAGADAFVRKEEDLEVILARVDAVLRGSSGQRAEMASLVGPMRVLAVDDSATYLEELGSVLRGEGYDVVLARSGEEAIELLSVQSVDCILLDLLMPGLGGKETCRHIKESAVVRDAPLILLTALEDRAAMIDGLGAGADDFVSKSSDFDVLKAKIRAQLRHKQFEDEHRRLREELLRSELRTNEERAARQFAESRASFAGELERKNKELETFSYSVSHDLRAPLRTIEGFSRALIEDYTAVLDEQGRDYLIRVRAAADRMGELIEDLLALSRVSGADLRRVQANLSIIARAVATELQGRDPKRQLEIAIQDDMRVDADARLMRVLLDNLMGNAWKFTERVEGARIEFGAEVSAAGTVYFVRDNGAGFDMAFAEKLFTPFQRLHTEEEFPGTGIGLATVYRIVDRHGGCVWAEGAVGRGATVFFTVPPPPRMVS